MVHCASFLNVPAVRQLSAFAEHFSDLRHDDDLAIPSSILTPVFVITNGILPSEGQLLHLSPPVFRLGHFDFFFLRVFYSLSLRLALTLIFFLHLLSLCGRSGLALSWIGDALDSVVAYELFHFLISIITLEKQLCPK